VRAYRTFKERIAWYDPAKKRAASFNKMEMVLQYLAAIRRVRMSWEKARCYMQMAEVVYLELDIPLKDLIKAASWRFTASLNFESSRQIL